MEDEDAIFRMVARRLRDSFAIVRARNADEALSALATTKFAFFVLDVGLKDDPYGGLAVLEVVCREQPGRPCIVLTGRFDDPAVVNAVAARGVLLAKPLDHAGAAAFERIASLARGELAAEDLIDEVVAVHGDAHRWTASQRALVRAVAAGKQRSDFAAAAGIGDEAMRKRVRGLLAPGHWPTLESLIASLLRGALARAVMVGSVARAIGSVGRQKKG